MTPHTLYETETGKIVRTVYLPQTKTPKPKEGCLYVAGDYSGDVFYCPDGAVIPRPKMVIKENGAQISDVPVGASVAMNGFALPVGTTEFTATSPVSGVEVEITIECWPFSDLRFSVLAEQQEQEAS